MELERNGTGKEWNRMGQERNGMGLGRNGMGLERNGMGLGIYLLRVLQAGDRHPSGSHRLLRRSFPCLESLALRTGQVPENVFFFVSTEKKKKLIFFKKK